MSDEGHICVIFLAESMAETIVALKKANFNFVGHENVGNPVKETISFHLGAGHIKPIGCKNHDDGVPMPEVMPEGANTIIVMPTGTETSERLRLMLSEILTVVQGCPKCPAVPE